MATTTSTVSRPAPVRKSERTSMLARLLATENITVLHDAGAQTASFNLRERTLILPCWRTDNQRVYDFLVGHEVGHAKHTPADAWLAGCISIGGTNPRAQVVAKDYLNVVEDARIERAIKREFPGLRHDFVEGYRVLHADLDIFKARGRDVSGLPLIDRLNLHFKIGVHCGEVIPFAADEIKWVDAVAACRTWEDVVEVARDLYNLAKTQQSGNDEQGDGESSESQDGEQSSGSKRGKREDGDNADSDGERGERGEVSDDADGESQDLTDAQDGDDADGDEGEQTEDGNADGESGDTESKDAAESQDAQDADSEGNTEAKRTDGEREEFIPEAASTVRQFEDGMGRFAQGDYMEQTLRVEGIDIGKVLVSSERFVELASKVEDPYCRTPELAANIPALVAEAASKMFKAVTTENARAVDLMVKRFEQRRAALNFARQSSHKTGRISTRHLSKYKFSEDIFDRVVIQPDQQNHGIVILLDWSGSMGGIIYQTAKQMLALVQFCRRVGIPAKVSIFTTNACPWGAEKYGASWTDVANTGAFGASRNLRDISHEFTDSVFGLPAGTTKQGGHVTLMPFGIIDIYDSRMNNRDFAKVMGHFLLTASLNGNRSEIPTVGDGRVSFQGYRVHPELNLGYTPLDESILAMRSIVNEFRKNGNQKVTLIAMTDGEGNSLDWAHSDTNAPKVNTRRFAKVIIDGTTGRRFNFGQNYNCGSTTQTASEMFKDATGCDFVSISLIDSDMLRYGITTVTRAIEDTYAMPKDWQEAQRMHTSIMERLEKQYKDEGMITLDGTSTKWFFVKVGVGNRHEEMKAQRRLDKMKNRAVAETRAFIAAQKKEATNRNFINALMDCVS